MGLNTTTAEQRIKELERDNDLLQRMLHDSRHERGAYEQGRQDERAACMRLARGYAYVAAPPEHPSLLASRIAEQIYLRGQAVPTPPHHLEGELQKARERIAELEETLKHVHQSGCVDDGERTEPHPMVPFVHPYRR